MTFRASWHSVNKDILLMCTLLLGVPLPITSAHAQVGPATRPTPTVGQKQSGPETSEADHEDPLSSRKRALWFQHQRAFPHAHIPAGAYWRAQQQRKALVAKHKALFQGFSPEISAAADPLSTVTWMPDGPQPLMDYPRPVSGRATSIAVDPTDPNTVYIGTAGGGVWKTTDGGQTWKPLTDTQLSLAIGAVAIDPNNPDTVYAGTGEADGSADSYYGQGLLKSTDAGSTWTLIRAPFTSFDTAPDFSQIAVQPGNSNVILAATVYSFYTNGGGDGVASGGVYRSSDGGQTWNAVLVPGSGFVGVSSVMFDVKNPTIAYAGVGENNAANAAVYKSSDGGQTWTPAGGTGSNTLPAPSSVARIALAEDSSGATLYAAVALISSDANFGTPGSIYKSTDGGANWTDLGPPDATDGPDWYRDAIAVDPANSNVLYASGILANHSVDGGKTWTQGVGGSGVYADQHAFAFSADGSRLYMADDGGIFVTNDPADVTPVSSSLNQTLNTMTFYPGFSVSPNSEAQLLAGSQDHGIDLYQGSLAWNQTAMNFCGDGGAAYIDPVGSYAYAHCPGRPTFTLVANPSGGVSSADWVETDSGIDPDKTDSLPWVADIKGDWQTPSIIYTATNYLYQSLDSGVTWTRISSDLHGYAGNVTTIAVSPSDSNTVYIGRDNSVIWVTHNALSGASATWTVLSGLPDLSVTKIVVAPESPNDVYVTFSGFDQGHVFHSTDGGASWTNISGDLPNTPVNSIAVDPDIQNTIYVATDTGVYFTEDGGTDWSLLGTGLPNVVVQDILMYEPTRTLHVITHGRGAWETIVPLVGLQASAAELQFANQLLNTTSSPRTVILTNNQQSTSLNITGFNVTGPFAQTDDCGQTLAAGSTCTVSVTFTPNAEGNLQGTLAISGSTNQVVVLLSGIGTISPTVTVTPFSASITTTEALGVTVAVNGGAGNPTPTGSVTLSGGGYTSGVTALSGGEATINIPAGSLSTGSVSLTADYTPDSNGSSTYNNASGSATVTVTAPTYSLTATNVGVSRGASGTSTITADSTDGYAGTISFTCSVTSSPADANHVPTCTSSGTVTLDASTTAGTASVTVSTTAPNTSALVSPKMGAGKGWSGAFGGGLLAALMILWLPKRRRYWRSLLGIVIVAAALGAFAGCGGGGGSSPTLTPDPGTTTGTYAIQVKGTGSDSGHTTATTTFTLTVN